MEGDIKRFCWRWRFLFGRGDDSMATRVPASGESVDGYGVGLYRMECVLVMERNHHACFTLRVAYFLSRFIFIVFFF